MTVALTVPRSKPNDNDYEIIIIAANYASNRAMVKIRFQNGDERDIIFEGPRLVALRNAVSQFSGLKLAVEQFLAANEPGLEGVAS